LISPSKPPLERRAAGQKGEQIAARHLAQAGYKVLYRNFRAPHGGEVDLICRHGDTLVFVEVKARASLAYGRPGAAVNRHKQRLLGRGALAWLRMLDHPQIPFRFDVVEVVFGQDAPAVHIISDAFELPEPWIY
jgi:putative endonuclease